MELLLAVLAGVALFAFAGFVLLRLWRGRRSGISIRMQVFVSMAAVSGVFAAMLGLISVQRLESRSALLSEEVAREDAELVAGLLGAAGGPIEAMAKTLARQRPSLGEEQSGLRIQLFDTAGRLLYDSGDSGDPPLSSAGQGRLSSAGQGRLSSAGQAPLSSGASQTAPIRSGDRLLGQVRIIRPTLGWRRILRDVASRAAVLTLLLVVGTASASALIGRAIAKPIERLTGAASRIAHGERQAVLPRPVGREVRTLTAAVESMRRELEGRHLAERLAADLSHQLKNPVAAIRASAEVLADGALEEPATARRFVGRILEATERVLGLINNLLALTRLQARGVEAELVDVGELARLSADAHLAQAERRRVRIDVSAVSGAGAVVRGDRAWLRRAIDNLIDNALTFAEPAPQGPSSAESPLASAAGTYAGTSAGTSGRSSASSASAAESTLGSAAVQVRVRSAEPHVILEVGNLGPGIAPEVRDRLFQRFVTTRKDTGGSGLGLAIVAAVAEQHGGNVEVAAAGPPRTEFRLTLPRVSATLHQIFP